MWIAILIWFLVLIAVAVAVLALARAESHRDAFSASIPDGEEYEARRALEEERRRGTGRIVAPGIVIQPATKVEPGVTTPSASSDEGKGDEPVVVTSSKVVEVQGILGPRKPVLSGSTKPANARSQKDPAIPAAEETKAAAPAAPAAPAVPAEPSLSTVVPGVAEVPLPARDDREDGTPEDEGSSSLAHLVSKTEEKEARKD
ncbi:MAG: hypothetical protein LKI93_03940 [Bifidobacteriaceae bacterium]|nr:hypothetical protein [Bifidobacteriaceae bacterium]